MKPITPPCLNRYDLTCQPTGAVEPLGNAGGFSGAQLWKFDSPRGPLVLRRWPSPTPDPRRVEQVHFWLNELRDFPFIPAPIAIRDGSTFIEWDGSYWELAPWMAGVADLSRPPSPDHLRLMFGSLASLHVRLGRHAQEGISPGILARIEELERLIQTEFVDLDIAIHRALVDPCANLARVWLERAQRVAVHLLDEARLARGWSLLIQPCLRDVRPDHFLFEDGRLTGLVDFGAMGWESISADLARLFGEAAGNNGAARAEAYEAYESVRPLNRGQIRAIVTFERLNAVLGPARWVRWHFVESRAFDQPDAALHGLRRGLERLDDVGL